jgi:hypothetical protein
LMSLPLNNETHWTKGEVSDSHLTGVDTTSNPPERSWLILESWWAYGNHLHMFIYSGGAQFFSIEYLCSLSQVFWLEQCPRARLTLYNVLHFPLCWIKFIPS